MGLVAFLTDGGDPAVGRDRHPLDVGRSELAGDADQPAVVAHPLPQQIVQERHLEIAHPEGAGVAGGPAGVIVHVDGHELVVDGGVAVPVVEPRGAGERGQLLARLQILHCGGVCHGRRPLNNG